MKRHAGLLIEVHTNDDGVQSIRAAAFPADGDERPDPPPYVSVPSYLLLDVVAEWTRQARVPMAEYPDDGSVPDARTARLVDGMKIWNDRLPAQGLCMACRRRLVLCSHCMGDDKSDDAGSAQGGYLLCADETCPAHEGCCGC